MTMTKVTLVFAAIFGLGSCDYKCICNYNVEKSVQESPSVQSNVIGYMYEFDCKPQAGISADADWLQVAYEHKLGFVEMDNQLQVQTCPGAIPDEDKLPTTTAPKTTIPVTTEAQTTIPPTSEAKTTVEELTTVPTTLVVSSTQYQTTKETTTVPTTSTTTAPITTESTTFTNPSTALPTTAVPTTKKVPTSTTRAMPSTKKTTTTDATTKSTRSLPSSTISTTSATTITTSRRTTSRSTSTLRTTSTTRSTTTTQSITSTPTLLKGHVELCPQRIQQLAAKYGDELLAQYGQNCYEIIDSGVSWSHAESICKGHGGHLIHIANQQEQDFIFEFLVKHHTHTVWLGLNDRNTEEKFEWTSGNPVTYENWKIGRKDYRDHNYEDCVYMTPTTGEWDDVECGNAGLLSAIIPGIRHAFICQYAVVTLSGGTTPPKPVINGNINLCPYRLRVQAQRDKGILAQRDHSCYELIQNTKVSWLHAEEICSSRGGHLVYITTSQEQTFIQSFMKSHYPDHAVWIGLTDKNTEGRFHWASGLRVQYTNWVPGHIANYVSSSQEDCVVFIPYKNGQWDDIPCGYTQHHFFGGTSSSGETHPLLCEYSISTGPSLIG